MIYYSLVDCNKSFMATKTYHIQDIETKLFEHLDELDELALVLNKSAFRNLYYTSISLPTFNRAFKRWETSRFGDAA